jgi:hypothetical protein
MLNDWGSNELEVKLSQCLIKRSAMTYAVVWVLLHHSWPLDRVEWSVSRCGHFTPGERAFGTHWIRGCVNSTAGRDSVQRILPCWISNPGRLSRGSLYCGSEIKAYPMFFWTWLSVDRCASKGTSSPTSKPFGNHSS